jgi:hypothetical protein
MEAIEEGTFPLEDLHATLICSCTQYRIEKLCPHSTECRRNRGKHDIDEDAMCDDESKDSISLVHSPGLYSAASTASFESSRRSENGNSLSPGSCPCSKEESSASSSQLFELEELLECVLLPPPSPPSPPTPLKNLNYSELRTHGSNTTAETPSTENKHRQHVRDNEVCTMLQAGGKRPERSECTACALAFPERNESTKDDKYPFAIEISTPLTQLLARNETSRKRMEAALREEQQLPQISEPKESDGKHSPVSVYASLQSEMLTGTRQECEDLESEARGKCHFKTVDRVDVFSEASIFKCMRRRPDARYTLCAEFLLQMPFRSSTSSKLS